MALPTVLTIDVEPDNPWPPLGNTDPWYGFEAWLDYVPELRIRLEKATGAPVHFNWMLRMDDQIAGVYGDAGWVAHAYGRQLESLRAEGDELGLHPHAWRWEQPPGQWLQDHANEEWVAQVIATSFSAYRDAFGADCRLHRFGSRYITPAIVRQIEALGVRVDMTVEPGARGMVALEKTVPATGWLPDQTWAPRAPYRPSQEDPLRPTTTDAPADGGIWMLPATAFDPAPWLTLWRRQARRVRFAGRPRHRPAELWAPVQPEQFWRLAGLAADELATPYLSLALRSDCLIRPRMSETIRAKLDRLVDQPIVGRMRFVTATEALGELVGSQ
jgi:hypothetical protein